MTGSTAPAPVDLLIRHAYVITMDDLGTLIPDGAVAIAGRDIRAVGPDGEVAGEVEPAHVIDAAGAPVHPGLVETHLHASYQTYRGAVPDVIREVDVFPTIEHHFYEVVTPEEEELGCLLSSLEMIRNGTTCFLEAGTILEPEAGARAARTVGIRAVLGDACIIDQPAGYAQGKEEREPSRLHLAGTARPGRGAGAAGRRAAPKRGPRCARAGARRGPGPGNRVRRAAGRGQAAGRRGRGRAQHPPRLQPRGHRLRSGAVRPATPSSTSPPSASWTGTRRSVTATT